jgi:hypothetical protein
MGISGVGVPRPDVFARFEDGPDVVLRRRAPTGYVAQEAFLPVRRLIISRMNH